MTPVRILPAILLCLLAVGVQAETAEEKGLAIAVEAHNRDSGFVDYTNDVQMILRNKQGEESIRLIRSKTLEVDGDDRAARAQRIDHPLTRSRDGRCSSSGYGYPYAR